MRESDMRRDGRRRLYLTGGVAAATAGAVLIFAALHGRGDAQPISVELSAEQQAAALAEALNASIKTQHPTIIRMLTGSIRAEDHASTTIYYDPILFGGNQTPPLDSNNDFPAGTAFGTQTATGHGDIDVDVARYDPATMEFIPDSLDTLPITRVGIRAVQIIGNGQDPASPTFVGVAIDPENSNQPVIGPDGDFVIPGFVEGK